MIENNTSMIIDANCLTVYKAVEENFGRFNAPCFFIKFECNEEEILRRLDEREKTFGLDENNYSRATRKDYYRYLERLDRNPFPKDKIFYTINTEDDLDIQTDLLVSKIKNVLNIK